MREKTVGYVLLIFSVMVIIGVVVNVYLVFIGQLQPVSLFSSLGDVNLLPGLETSFLGQSGNETTRSLNVFAHLALASFISSAVFKIGRLGAMMARPVKISLNQEKT
ncbi:MAG: hypothetical protein PHX72_01475 [Candidatus Shapirobacteria bacterium]|nr:hypothetical protein [Candidatus Shapirobacteria bacterium]